MSLAGSSTYVNGASYNKFDQFTLVQYGNATRTTYDYYAYNGAHPYRLWKLYSGTDADPDAFRIYTYTYDLAGNIASIQDGIDSNQVVTYHYDELNRLRQAYTTGGTDTYNNTYTYTAIGNITAAAGVGYAYDNPAHVHAVTAVGGTSFGYDASGNLTERVTGGVTTTYGYDYEGRLLAVSGPVTAAFSYNGDGQKAISVIGNDTTYHVSPLPEVRPLTPDEYSGAGSSPLPAGAGRGILGIRSPRRSGEGKNMGQVLHQNLVQDPSPLPLPAGAGRGILGIRSPRRRGERNHIWSGPTRWAHLTAH